MKRVVKLLLVLLVSVALFGCQKESKTIVVNFDTQGGSSINAVVLKDDKSKISKPANPSKEGYIFKYWELNGNPYDFEDVVKEDITLKAVWEKVKEDEKTVTVKVIINGESKEYTFKEGEAITIPTPSVEGKIFAGWKIDGKDGNLSDAKDGSTIEAVFTDKRVACTGLKGEYNNYWAIEGIKPYNLNVVVSPSDCTDVPVYTSDDESIVKVDQNGNVSPLKVGKTKIHVVCGDKKLELGFETRPKEVKLEKIEIEDSIVIDKGGKATIKVKYYPENTTQKALKFKSADSARVSVNAEGVIVGLIPGPCIVYVTDENGNTIECYVNVNGEYLDIDLPLFSELSYSAGNYTPCSVFIHGYKDGAEYKNDVTGSATLGYDSYKLRLSGHKLYLDQDPGSETTMENVWFTYNGEQTNAVTIYVKP